MTLQNLLPLKAAAEDAVISVSRFHQLKAGLLILRSLNNKRRLTADKTSVDKPDGCSRFTFQRLQANGASVRQYRINLRTHS